MRRDDTIGFADLHVQLRITNRLLAAQLRGSMKQVELIKLLASVGASNVEISEVLGTTPATVKTALQRLKRIERGGAGVDERESLVVREEGETAHAP